MKRLFFFIPLFISLTVFCQKEKAKALQEFIASKEFDEFSLNSAFANAGDLDFDNTISKKIINPQTKSETSTYILPFKEDGKTQGAIQFMKVKEGFSKLPNNSKYLLIYRDYSNYDFNTKTGIIRIYDLNYDEYLATELRVNLGKIVDFIALPMPETIKEKYKHLKLLTAHPCDLNNNGNVSWGECYSCMKSACSGSPDCDGMCDIIDLFGGQCTGSIAASCAILSAIY